MAPGFQRVGRWLWAVSLLLVASFPELTLALRVALCISPPTRTSGDLWSLGRDFLVSDSSSGPEESYTSLSIRSQKHLWKWESLGRCHELRVICFLISSQETGGGMLFKWRPTLWKLGSVLHALGKGKMRFGQSQTAVMLWKLWMAWGWDGHKIQERSCS